jgi:thiol-disulfide isomerase/thioredoxin
MKIWHRIGAAIGSVSLTLIAAILLWQAGLPQHPPPLTEVYPFEAETLDGQVIKINHTLNRPLIITFWATWCIPCQIEMPLLQAAYQTYHDEQLLVIGINTGVENSLADIQTWLSAYTIQFPIVIDTFQELQAIYNVRGVPTTFFIDRHGQIQEVLVGGFGSKDLAKGLEAIDIDVER